MRPWDLESSRALPSAAVRLDLVAVLDLVADRNVGAVAHRIGPSIIAALGDGDSRAVPVAIECISHLEERGATDGDQALANRLRAAVDPSVTSDLEVIPDLDLDDVAGVLDDASHDLRQFVNVETGELRLIDDTADDLDDDLWLELWNWDSSSEAWQDMRDFTDRIEDPALAERLQEAIRGKGAFRRFRDIVYRTDLEQTRWNTFRGERSLGRARSWLAAQGYRPD